MQYQSVFSPNQKKNIHNIIKEKYFIFIKNNNDNFQDITLSIDNPSTNKEIKNLCDFNTSNIIKSQNCQDEESKSYIKELLDICNCVKKQKKYNTPYRGLNTGDLLEISKRRKKFFLKKENKYNKIKRIHTADEKNLFRKNKNDKQDRINKNNIDNIKKLLLTKKEKKLWTNFNNNKKKSIYKYKNNYKICQTAEKLDKNCLKNQKKDNNKSIIYNKNYKFNSLIYNSNKFKKKSSSKFITQPIGKKISNKIQSRIKYSKSALFKTKNDHILQHNTNNKIKYFHEINVKIKKNPIPIKNSFEEQIIFSKTINSSKKGNMEKKNINYFLKNSSAIKQSSNKKIEKCNSDSNRIRNPINLNNNNNYSLSSKKNTLIEDNNDLNFENILCTKESLNINNNNNRKAHIIDIKYFKRKKSINNYANGLRKQLTDKNIFDLSNEEKVNSTSLNPQVKVKKSRIVSIYIDSKFMLFNKI